MRMRVRMQQIQLFFLVLELKHVGGFSQDQQVGDHSLSSFVPLQDKQTNKGTFNKQRGLCGSLSGGSTELSCERATPSGS